MVGGGDVLRIGDDRLLSHGARQSAYSTDTATVANCLAQQLPPHSVQFSQAEAINNIACQFTLDPQTGEVIATRGATSKRLPPHKAKSLSKLLRSLFDEQDLPIVCDVAIARRQQSQS